MHYVQSMSSAQSVSFQTVYQLNATVAKVQKGRTDGEILLEEEETFLAVLSDVSPRNEGILFPFVASRPAINNVLSILSTAEIECHEEGYSRDADEGVDRAFFEKERVCLIVGIISLNWAATQRYPHKGCTKSASRYATVEYYIQDEYTAFPLVTTSLSMTRDYY